MMTPDNDIAFAELMKSEHEELTQALHDTNAELHSADRQRIRINDKVLHLSELVESHFRHEEQGGYMKEALTRAPRLGPLAEILQEQHVELQEEIDKLRLLVHSGVESLSWWERIRADFDHFATRLRTHEHAETELFQEAFNREIGAGD
ncbi:hypothetical protein OAS39_08065 [Pirellulales bacterium]|nr:hypothetical protein [Pirellulales bacterium]